MEASMTESKFTFTTRNSIETIDHIPQELKEREQWLCYRIDGDDKIPKAPRWTIDGDLHIKNIGVRSNDEWVTYDEAKSFVDETQEKLSPQEALDGVGFCLTSDDPYAFLDLDYHIDGSEISDLAQEWLDSLDSWTEVSSSGTGAHVFCKADDFSFDGLRKRDDDIGVELYTEARFCATTGDTLPQYNTSVMQRDNSLSALAEEYLDKEEDDSSMEPIEPDWDCESEKDADAAIKTACAYDDTFETLHRGGTVHQDTSHDDISYLTKCFFWAKGDKHLVREMARKSERTRSKWDEPRNGSTWFGERLEEARKFQDDTFSGDYL